MEVFFFGNKYRQQKHAEHQNQSNGHHKIHSTVHGRKQRTESME